jgi:glycosyltransferase involved in cell wall biosynthesis
MRETIKTTLKAVDCAAFKESVGHTDGDWGQWAYPDVQDLAERILSVASLPGACGTEGSDHVRQHYSWDLVAEKILHFLYVRLH